MEELLPYFQALGGGKSWHDVSRKLTLVDEDLDITFFLAKSMDVPTYVEYGAADIGVSGKDVLLEHDKNVVELLDLGLSKCELVVAVPDAVGCADGDGSPFQFPCGDQVSEGRRGVLQ